MNRKASKNTDGPMSFPVSIEICRLVPLRLPGVIAFLFIAVVSCSSNVLAADADDKTVARYRSAIRVAKLLWKANPTSAAKTLKTAIDQAVTRDQIDILQEPLANVGDLTAAWRDYPNEDPRRAVAITSNMLLGKLSVSDGIQTANELKTEDRGLFARVAIAIDARAVIEWIHSRVDVSNEQLDSWTEELLVATADQVPGEAAKLSTAAWTKLSPDAQAQLVVALSRVAESMYALVQAVESGRIEKSVVNPNQLLKWQDVDGDQVTKDLQVAIRRIWGQIGQSSAERQKLVAEIMAKVKAGAHGSEANGRQVFARVCSQCHKLEGKGYDVGPEITNNGRGNFSQLVSNILDPSLVIGEAFQSTTILTVDGNVVSGILASKTDDFVKLKVQGGKVVEFSLDDIDAMKLASKSLMPEGLEEQMTEQELFDLLAFLSVLRKKDAEELIPGVPESFVK